MAFQTNMSRRTAANKTVEQGSTIAKIGNFFMLVGIMSLPVAAAYQSTRLDPTLEDLQKQHPSLDVTAPMEVTRNIKWASFAMLIVVTGLVYNYHKMSSKAMEGDEEETQHKRL